MGWGVDGRRVESVVSGGRWVRWWLHGGNCRERVCESRGRERRREEAESELLRVKSVLRGFCSCCEERGQKIWVCLEIGG